MYFYDATNYSQQASVTVGATPDAVTYTQDGSRLLVANAGEPSSYLVNTVKLSDGLLPLMMERAGWGELE